MTTSQKHILIVEDDLPIAHSLQLALTNAGYATVVAENGEQAQKMLRAEKFDLVLLDLIMPKLNGFGVLKSLRAEGNRVPVIITSSLEQKSDQREALALGAQGYLVKTDVPTSHMVAYVKNFLHDE